MLILQDLVHLLQLYNIYLKSHTSGRKVILIFDAHLLSDGAGESANALLKILEDRKDPNRWASPGDTANYTSSQECMIQSKADDGVISASEKSLCDQVNRTWAIDTQIYDNYGNLIGTQALNNCNDLGCRTFTMGEAIQYASNLADAYARISSSEIDKYANQWASGQISYGEYERKAMASMEYYGNQYVYEMESIYDMIIID